MDDGQFPPQASGAQGDDNPFGFPGGANPPAQQPEDTTPANYQIGSKLPKVIGIKIPAHSLNFDEQYFLHLLGGSISLTKEEKKRIIESVPKLKQSQIDELIRIFEEERRKFAELSAKHVEQLKKLEDQHLRDWNDIELEQKAQQKQSSDQAQADEIRKKLGLG
ncbi:MAG: hypothetical protein U0519_00775 [Candidatus Gracilibacteria bacterium]